MLCVYMNPKICFHIRCNFCVLTQIFQNFVTSVSLRVIFVASKVTVDFWDSSISPVKATSFCTPRVASQPLVWGRNPSIVSPPTASAWRYCRHGGNQVQSNSMSGLCVHRHPMNCQRPESHSHPVWRCLIALPL